MATWTRAENWNVDPPKFIEVTVDGAVLWMRKGTANAGRRPIVERRELSSPAEAEKAQKSELAKLRRGKFDEVKTVDGPLPTPEDLAAKPDVALARGPVRWAGSDATAKKQAFFERIRMLGIDPAQSFASQASDGGRAGTDGAEARDRDADVRASLCLKIAKEMLGASLHLTWEQGHDGRTLSDVFESAEKIFERANRKRP